jgi:hypothetical protein
MFDGARGGSVVLPARARSYETYSKKESKEEEGRLIQESESPLSDSQTDMFSRESTESEPLTSRQKTKKRKTRARSRLPDDWSPGREGVEFARERDMDLGDIRTEAERFVAHHRGKGSLMADWAAAWRFWVLNAPRFAAWDSKGGREYNDGVQ